MGERAFLLGQTWSAGGTSVDADTEHAFLFGQTFARGLPFQDDDGLTDAMLAGMRTGAGCVPLEAESMPLVITMAFGAGFAKGYSAFHKSPSGGSTVCPMVETAFEKGQ